MKRNLKKGVNIGKEVPTGGGNPSTPTFYYIIPFSKLIHGKICPFILFLYYKNN